MLPFLPALLLLILRGPSAVEPGLLLHCQASGSEAVFRNVAQRQGINALLTAPSHQAIAHAIAQLLALTPLKFEAPAEGRTPATLIACEPHPSGEEFAKSQRSRDGPLAV